MATTVTLVAESKFGHTGQYIARLRGRTAKFVFDRDFIGRRTGKRQERTTVETDEVGLYETCDIGKNGKYKSYDLVVEWGGGVVRLVSDPGDARVIAKRLSAGECLGDIVAVERGTVVTVTTYQRICSTCGATCTSWTCACGSTDVAPQTIRTPKLNDDGSEVCTLVYTLRSKREVNKAISADTIEGAVAAFVKAIEGLPAEQQAAALASAKQRLFPPTDKHAVVDQDGTSYQRKSTAPFGRERRRARDHETTTAEWRPDWALPGRRAVAGTRAVRSALHRLRRKRILR